MTHTQRTGQDGAGAGTKTIHHLFEIAASREAVFDSIATADGLSAWWTTQVSADEAAVGGHIDFTFRGPFNPRMRITRLDKPARVGWQGTGGHAAWGDTIIRFDLDATSSGTMVRFSHQLGGDASDDAVAAANFNWGYYLESLRLLCETGHGKPFQVGTAGVRVGANSLA